MCLHSLSRHAFQQSINLTLEPLSHITLRRSIRVEISKRKLYRTLCQLDLSGLRERHICFASRINIPLFLIQHDVSPASSTLMTLCCRNARIFGKLPTVSKYIFVQTYLFHDYKKKISEPSEPVKGLKVPL